MPTTGQRGGGAGGSGGGGFGAFPGWKGGKAGGTIMGDSGGELGQHVLTRSRICLVAQTVLSRQAAGTVEWKHELGSAGGRESEQLWNAQHW